MNRWYNDSNGESRQVGTGWKVYPHYSCVYDSNDPDGASQTIDFRNNFSHKPDFAYPYSDDPNVFINVHLATDPYSFCKDKGGPGSYADQKDMDNEDRAADGVVDVGADEITCNNVYNPLDWNADGLVNYEEFNRFSRAWLTYDPNNPLCDPNNPNYISDPNDPGYISDLDKERFNPICDLDSDLDVDLGDLLIFADDNIPWLWVACWRYDVQEMQQQINMLMGNNGNEQLALSRPVLSEVERAEGMVSPAPSISMKISPPVETVAVAEETVEPIEFNPAAERRQVLSLLESVDAMINAGGDDTETWREVKNLLEQSLVETEDIANETAEF